jgi:hypothetical protein
MKNYYIKLVGFPYFYNYKDDFDVYKKEDTFDFNQLYRNILFSKDVLKYIKFNNLSKEELLILKYLLKNLQISKEIFLLLKFRDINVNNIFFAFNIINTLLIFINKNLDYEEIYFY